MKQGKAIPIQAWTGHKCSRRLRLPDIKTLINLGSYKSKNFLSSYPFISYW